MGSGRKETGPRAAGHRGGKVKGGAGQSMPRKVLCIVSSRSVVHHAISISWTLVKPSTLWFWLTILTFWLS